MADYSYIAIEKSGKEIKGKAAPGRLFSCASQRLAVHFFDRAEVRAYRPGRWR